MVELLEQRLQLSSASFVDGRLSIEVTGNDSVQVSASQGQTVVRFNGHAAAIGSVAASNVAEILVDADAENSGNNRIDLSRVTSTRFANLTRTTLFGGHGNDTIIGSSLPDDIDGGSGRDWLEGRAGHDVINGGDGRDWLWGGIGSDLLHGGADEDTLNGGVGDDTLCGDNGADSLSGNAGTDWLEGGVGKDTLRGGRGMDYLMGDTSGDVLRDTTWENASDLSEGAGDGSGGPVADQQTSAFTSAMMPPSSFLTWTVSVAAFPTAMMSEAGGMITFRISLSAPAMFPLSVDYATSNGSAMSGSDYSGTSGTATFNPGDSFYDVFVSAVNDTATETFETFSMVLSNPSVLLSIGAGSASAMILDDDTGIGSGSGSGSGSGTGAITPTVSISSGMGVECPPAIQFMPSDGKVNFWVSLSSMSSNPVTVSFASTSGTATENSDYTAVGSLTIPANSLGEYLRFPIIDDALFESPESFTVTLTGATGADVSTNPSDNTVTGNIYDDEPTLSITDGWGAESTSGMGLGSGNGKVQMAVTLSNASSNTVTVQFSVSDGTATSPADYSVSGSSTLTFLPGELTKYVNADIVDDAIVEPGAPEEFTVTLLSATGAGITTPTATGHIYDNEPSLSIADGWGTEWTSGFGTGSATGSGKVRIPVTMNGISSNTVTVQYSTSDGSATDPNDYTATSGTLTFAAGPFGGVQYIEVPIIDDAVVELGGPETFTVTLSNPTGASLDSTTTATGHIFDNEPEISITDADGYEGGGDSGFGTGDAVFNVTLSHASPYLITVNYSTQDGTAASPDDYVANSGTITFMPGETTKRITVLIEDDDIDSEPIETFDVVLSGATAASILDSFAAGRIIDRPRIVSRRVAGGDYPAEAYFPVKNGEHYEHGSLFRFKLKSPPFGMGNLKGNVAAKFPYFTDGVGIGTEVSSGLTAFGNYHVLYFNDSDASGFPDPGEWQLQSPTFHVQLVNTVDVKVRYSSALIVGPMTQVQLETDIRDAFSEVSKRAITKDREDDFRSIMKFNVTDFVQFAVDATHPDPANSQAKRDLLFQNAGSYTFTIVTDLGLNSGGNDLAGDTEGNLPTSFFGTHVLIDWNEFGKTGALLHEFLHTKGFYHNDVQLSGGIVLGNNDQQFIMHSNYFSQANILDQDEADSLD